MIRNDSQWFAMIRRNDFKTFRLKGFERICRHIEWKRHVKMPLEMLTVKIIKTHSNSLWAWETCETHLRWVNWMEEQPLGQTETQFAGFWNALLECSFRKCEKTNNNPFIQNFWSSFSIRPIKDDRGWAYWGLSIEGFVRTVRTAECQKDLTLKQF